MAPWGGDTVVFSFSSDPPAAGGWDGWNIASATETGFVKGALHKQRKERRSWVK